MMMKKAIEKDTNGDGQADARGISKAAVIGVVDKYLDYVKEQAVIDSIFAEYDRDSHGESSSVLEPDQLKKLLLKVAPDTEVHDLDVKHVLESCDKDGDGNISRAEVLVACATWKSTVMAHENEAAKRSSSACTLL